MLDTAVGREHQHHGQISSAYGGVTNTVDGKVRDLGNQLLNYVDETAATIDAFEEKTDAMLGEVDKVFTSVTGAFKKTFGGSPEAKALLKLALGGIGAYAGFKVLKAVMLRVAAIRVNPMNNIERKLRNLSETEKTKKISQWVNSYADEPSPVSYDMKTGVYKSSIDTVMKVVRGQNLAKTERDKAETIFRMGSTVMEDLRADKRRA
eukprot:g13515.t1